MAFVAGEELVAVRVPLVDLVGHRLLEVPRMGQELVSGQAHQFGAIGPQVAREGVELVAECVVEVHIRAWAEDLGCQVAIGSDRGEVGGKVAGVVEEPAQCDPQRGGGEDVTVATARFNGVVDNPQSHVAFRPALRALPRAFPAE